MTVQHFVCVSAAMTLLLYAGCNAQPNTGCFFPHTIVRYPYMVHIKINNKSACAGSLITNQWVLTAAHCLTSEDLNRTLVYLRTYILYEGSDQLVRGLSGIYCHEDYDNKTFKNDICLLKLSSVVELNDDVNPVCLPEAESTFAPNTLHEGAQYVERAWFSAENSHQMFGTSGLSNARCKCFYRNKHEITDEMMCAIAFDSCEGDSGGPVVVEGSDSWIMSGIKSFSSNCTKKGFPTVYTRVSAYEDWIKNKVVGMRPAFARFESKGTDDDSFDCSVQTRSDGETLSHFTHYLSLTTVSMFSHVFVAGRTV